MRSCVSIGLYLSVVATFFTSSAIGQQEPSRIGKEIPLFELPSHRGQQHALQDYADDKLIVVAFLGTECPLAQLYGPRLAALHDEFSSQGVAFLGINSNTQDSMTELTAYANRYKIPFPMLKDVGNRVADQFGAQRTPEVFVLDQDRKVRYHGRIDDQYDVRYKRAKPERRDLAVALAELTSGKEVSVAETEAVGCLIGRVSKTEPKGEITFSNQIARIFNERCVECHREGQIAPFTLTSYEDTIGWEDTILEVIDENRMPPWFADPAHGEFSNDTRLSDEEKSLIRQWVENGMPEGDTAQLPDPPQFAEGWRMPEPEQVIYMRDEPFRVPAEGVIDYQYFDVDPGWDEDKYIYATEARPDNVSVVHHIIVYVVPPNADSDDDRNRQMLVGYAPGAIPTVLEDGVAIFVPAGSQLVFEMHYTPNGIEQLDRSYVGLSFLDKEQVKKRLQGKLAINDKFEIPPKTDDYPVTAEYRSPKDELLLSMTPHMHLRGKSFRYEAFYPDGSHEVLLDVPDYDFNWQLSYQLAEPKLLPKGTRILCSASFNDSQSNPVNPNWNKAIKWGRQSYDEMMIGFFNVVSPDKSAQELRSDASIDPTGEWTWKREQFDERLTLELDGEKLTGTLRWGGRDVSIEEAQIQGDRLTFEATTPDYGGLLLRFDATVDKSQMKGQLTYTVESIGRTQKSPWKAQRATASQRQ